MGQPSRTLFISRRQSYHGTTLGTLALGHHVARRNPFESVLLSNMSHVSPCNPYRGKQENQSDADYAAQLQDELEQEFRRLGPGNVAAVFIEPVVGAVSGFLPGPHL